MSKEETASRIRYRLDSQWANWPKGAAGKPPPNGWIATLRMALGMSTRQLAKRMNVTQAAIVGIEQSEIKGSIQLDTLQRVAKAMNGKLVYAIVPDEPLAAMLESQRLTRAADDPNLKPSDLESDVYKELVKAHADHIPLRQVWNDGAE